MPTYISAYDGSDSAAAALAVTRVLAQAAGADVIAAYVYPTLTPMAYAGGPGVIPVTTDVAESMRRSADQIVAHLLPDIERRLIPGGSVAWELHELARGERASMLAVGATHRGPLGQVVPGSIADRLVHGAPCPVLVVPTTADAERIETVAVAYDGRPESRRALRAAEALTRRLGSSMLLINAIDPGPAGIYLPQELNELDRALGGRHSALLESAATGLRRRGLEVETCLVLAPAGEAIVKACANADLLVSGSRGYGPLRSVMVGGASRHMIDHAPCPVLVVPRSATLALISDAIPAAVEV